MTYLIIQSEKNGVALTKYYNSLYSRILATRSILIKKVIFLVFLIGLLCLSGSLSFAQEEALSSVGALVASNVYITYLAIGAITDGHANEVYDDETIIELMQVLSNLSNSSSESRQELLNSGILDPDDFSYVTEMINILNLLVNEAQGYLKYIETGDVYHAKWALSSPVVQ